MNNLQIDVVFELVCPWCFSGKRNLEVSVGTVQETFPQIQINVNRKGIQLLTHLTLEENLHRALPAIGEVTV
ncbi:hypothetical protein [Microbulbifer elongatus]|uniref:hypothetical protein n=1 Tax=Microbulbifer elongatus TaxID=86173 RepID=UPI001E4997E9|nr:hypothetical protein [Microbulbifer elongatus]